MPPEDNGHAATVMKFECQEHCSCGGNTDWCDECTCWPDIIVWGKRYWTTPTYPMKVRTRMAIRKFKTRSIDTHDFTEHATLRGVITKMEDITIDDEPRATMVIDTGKRLTRVFHSKALEEAFDVAVIDDCIEIEFLGVKRLSAKKTFKRFSVQVWTGDLDDGEEKAPTG